MTNPQASPMSIEKLDDETEMAMRHFGEAVAGSLVSLGYETMDVDAASNALRARIKQLIQEARKEGADAMYLEIDSRGLPHD